MLFVMLAWYDHVDKMPWPLVLWVLRLWTVHVAPRRLEAKHIFAFVHHGYFLLTGSSLPEKLRTNLVSSDQQSVGSSWNLPNVLRPSAHRVCLSSNNKPADGVSL